MAAPFLALERMAAFHEAVRKLAGNGRASDNKLAPLVAATQLSWQSSG